MNCIAGACWAFAAAGAIESQIKMTTGKGGKLLDLSEQELIDCDLTDQSGCKGGSPYHAFKWIKDKGGMLEESEYPYEAQDGQCRINDGAIRKGKISTFGFVEEDEDELQEAVYSWGPTAVGIDSQDPNLKHFKSGIYKGPCGTNLDHAVLVVGYGVNKAGEKYWIVKNSWGETWGENGFFLMSRGENGKAGLCLLAQTSMPSTFRR